MDHIAQCLVLDISCLARDRFVHHTLTNKRLLTGDFSKLFTSFHLFWVADQAGANQASHSHKLIDCKLCCIQDVHFIHVCALID